MCSGYPQPTDLSRRYKLGRATGVGRRLVGPLLGNRRFSHSMRRKCPLLQSHTTQSLPESPTLAPPGGVHRRFILVVASHPHCTSKISMVGPPRLGRVDQMSLPLGIVLLEPAGVGQSLSLCPVLQLCLSKT